jgi:N-acetyl sugar amidotransferase
MPNTRPSTPFIDGQCAACHNFHNRPQIDWKQREEEFLRIVDQMPRPAGGYDVIVPSSGGKDSTYQVLKMIELGLRPLVVTASTCYLTEIGRKNIDNLSRFATTIEYTPNRTVRAKLNKLGLQLVGDISLPEHMAIFSIPYRIAAAFGIPTIIYGESPLMEYGGPIGSEKAVTMGRRYIMEHQGFLGMRPHDFIGMEGITPHNMGDYMLPSDSDLEEINAYFLGQFYPWDSRRNAEVAIDNGFTVCSDQDVVWMGAWWDFENLDNAETGIHDYFGYLKYGYGRLCAQISIDIRNGLVSRDDAYAVVKEHDGNVPIEYMGVRLERVLRHIGIDLKEYNSICDSFTNWELFGDKRGAYLKPILKEFSDVVPT